MPMMRGEPSITQMVREHARLEVNGKPRILVSDLNSPSHNDFSKRKFSHFAQTRSSVSSGSENEGSLPRIY